MNLWGLRTTMEPLRKEPSHKAEMISQLLFSEPVKVLEKKKDWCFIQSVIDHYQGWIVRTRLSRLLSPLQPKPCFIVDPYVKLNTVPLWFGIPLWCYEREKNSLKVRFETFEVIIPENFVAPPSASLYEKAIKHFLGVPYLWGGRSCMGIDCSGLVQLLFLMKNIRLPRDTFQQIHYGKWIAFQKRRRGHIAFFSEVPYKSVSHVGILLDKDTILHAHGWVRADFITPKGIFLKEEGQLSHYLLGIKKVV